MNETALYAGIFFYGLAVYGVCLGIISLQRKLDDRPTENDLRKRDEENSRRAFMRYTAKK